VTNLCDEIEQTLKTQGPASAMEQLSAALKEQKDFTGLFYALLMKKRHELGVSPIPTGPSQLLPQQAHAPYEEAIRDAARIAGRLYLESGNIPGAWAFYRMLGEPDPVRQALEKAAPAPGEDCQALIDIAYHQGVHPTKGFDLVLEHHGTCSAITLASGQDLGHGPEVRDYCIKRLVRTLHAELIERVGRDIERVQNFRPTSRSIPELLSGRDWLFADDMYHIDVSHLSTVVQMSQNLAPSEELDLARELCEYGKHLSSRFQFAADPPFENQFHDYAVFLDILAGRSVEEGVNHFRAKVESSSPEEVGTLPAEVLVNLLTKLGRDKEALAIARRFLANVDARRLSCPGIVDLCEKSGDYQTLAEIAREQNNPVHFLASLLAAKR
jgi:hypothetical protein